MIDTAELIKAVNIIENGGIVACPTETFYALCVRFDNYEALDSLYEIKGRAVTQAVSLMIPSADMVDKVALPPQPLTKKLMELHWPGPLTLLLNARAELPARLALNKKVAVRVPGQSAALELARLAGFPITATSANPAGEPPADTAQMVRDYFPTGVDMMLDDGKTPGGLPSTIADATGREIIIIREGAVNINFEG